MLNLSNQERSVNVSFQDLFERRRKSSEKYLQASIAPEATFRKGWKKLPRIQTSASVFLPVGQPASVVGQGYSGDCGLTEVT